MISFVGCFVVFTIINTFFHDIKISVLCLCLLLIIILVWYLVWHNKNKKLIARYTLICLISFAISLLAIVAKDYRYDKQLSNNFFYTNQNTSSNFVSPELLEVGYYIGTGMIVDTYAFGKYIFQNVSGTKYILNTSKKYQIGDSLRLLGYIKNTNLKNINHDFSGLWERNFDYDKWLIMKGYGGNIYEQNSIKPSPPKETWIMHQDLGAVPKNKYGKAYIGPNHISFISQMKRRLQSKIVSAYGEGRNAGLILGMLIGDKSSIPKSDYQGFVDSGLVHIIAVSGGNIIMLTVFLGAILFFLPFYIRNFFILCSIIVYALVCGMDSSVVRAVLFAGLGMIAIFAGKETNFRRSVGLVFVAMLLFNPYFLLYDLGFLLSFGAILGIRIITHREKNLSSHRSPKKTKNYFQTIIQRVYTSYIKPSLGANIGIFPVIIFFMGKINLVGFISNLFVLPIIPIVMIYGFVSILLYSLLPRDGFFYIQNILIDYIYKISELGSSYGIYLLVTEHKIKYLILILFVIWLIIDRLKNNKSSNQKSKRNWPSKIT